MQKYTVGFIFNPQLEKVLLVHKLNPEWQRGKINGIGGKIESDEKSRDGIVREIKEETSLVTKKDKWILLGTINSKDSSVDFYTYIYKDDLSNAKRADKEEIEWFTTDDLPDNVMNNLRWLIPLAIDKINNNEFESFNMELREEYEKH